MKKLNLLFASLALVLGACSSDEPDNDRNETPEVPDEVIKIELSRSEKDIVEAQNRFALRFYNAVVANSEDPGNTNIALSPLSAQMCLSMIANGASGDLYDSLMENFGASEISELNDFSRRMLSVLPTLNPSKVSIGFNNALWENTAIGGVNPSFTTILESEYGAKTFSVDFRTNNMQNVINSWVKDNTGGAIENIVPRPVNPESALAIADIFSFEGKWKDPFDKSNTAPADFYGTDGLKIASAMMMSARVSGLHFKYIPDVKVIGLPYGNGSYRMEIIIPDDNSKTPWEALNMHGDEFLNKYPVSGSNSAFIKLKMPRFEVSYNEEITEVLSDMGINLSAKDLNRISESGTSLDTFHAVHITNNEEGTKVVSATTGTGGQISSSPDNLEIEINRPFAYLIRERSTGAILFIGHIANPAKN